ncbi:MAG: hypothetical protein KDA65_13500, partial [Planctomycetaceae bacterium]|nr:hypothetical protein [Planctomycetaceae bacterium]
ESVRLFSIRQIAKTWWNLTRWGKSRACQTLAGLVKNGWLQQQSIFARPLPELSRPLLTWFPGAKKPNYHSIAQTLRRRANQEVKRVTILYATRQSVGLFGRGRLPTLKLTQATHDLGVSELFLIYRRQGFSAGRWQSEERLPADWPLSIRPDALLSDQQGNYQTGIEYGGDYPAQRLSELHAGFASIHLPYELW